MNKKIAGQINSYLPFSKSPIWKMKRPCFNDDNIDSWTHAHISHGEIARHYAEIAIAFWRDLKSKNLYTKQALYIIDLYPGTGRFTYHFLFNFFKQFDAIREPSDQVCYVMTDATGENIDSWRRHEKFSSYIKQGRLDFANYDVEKDHILELTEKNISLEYGSLTLPPIIIANDFLNMLPQDLFYLEKEEIYEGWLSLQPKENYHLSDAENPFTRLTLSYQKRLFQEPNKWSKKWTELVQHYAKTLPACSILFPSYALNVFDSLKKLHGEEMLLLSADRGSSQLQAFNLPQKPHIKANGRFSQPVNYHAMSQVIRMSNGKAWQSQCQEGLSTIAAIYSTSEHWPQTQITAQSILAHFNSNDMYQLTASLEEIAGSLTREQMLTYLRLSHWNTSIFYVFLPYIQLLGLSKAEHDNWEKALNQLWLNHLPVGEQYNLAYDLGLLATKMHRWQYAISLLQESTRYHNTHSPSHYNLGLAHWQLGQYQQAESELRKALAYRKEEHRLSKSRNIPWDKQNLNIEEQLINLMAWKNHCNALLKSDTLILNTLSHRRSNKIYITLLGQHHAEALYAQQRDTVLAEQVGIEVLTKLSQARQWIEDVYNSQKLPLAIIDPQYGLVGLIVLEKPLKPTYRQEVELHSTKNPTNTARFYYWVGSQYQNKGYATQALEILHQFAAKQDITHLFSTIDINNHASQRVAKKLGYKKLDFEFKRPWLNNQNLTYYQKVLSTNYVDSEAERYRTLSVYLKDFSIDLELKPRIDSIAKVELTDSETLKTNVIAIKDASIEKNKK